ncbi:MAG: hypothetical protein KDA61_06250 [Planctomycetales bacterium]|nr:hypothetical protein [Planctomycetales bacterium]
MATKVHPWGNATFDSFDQVLSRRADGSPTPDVVLLNPTAPTQFRLNVAGRLQQDSRRHDSLFIAIASWTNKLLRKRCMVANVDLSFAASLDESLVDALLQLESIRLDRSPGASCASDDAEPSANNRQACRRKASGGTSSTYLAGHARQPRDASSA